jgi:hypothetical protein
MRDDWSEFPLPQLHVLTQLSFAAPIHYSYGVKRLGMAASSIKAMERKGLVLRSYLREEGISYGILFLTLTYRGQKLRRDYIRWNRSVRRKVGSLPAAMARIADMPL